ncbi:MAG: PD40 domain-containing protein [Proteobacteria bacterium]|nr:PD40 domain-containing protein [Pseudomonadota bacterium]MBK9251641.1 PD40 domain-containing protein [Pseudomonadota bacterium]MCC6630942.1 PD40 domain-containing protein [Gammaproteobacteria bacterium]
MFRIRLLAAALAMAGVAWTAEQQPAAPPGPSAFQLALVTEQGQKTVLGTLPPSLFAPRISPDGKQVAFELAEETTPGQPPGMRLYVAPLGALDKRRALQYTLTSTRNIAPMWSPEGDFIVFLAQGNGSDMLFRQRADGYIQPSFVVDGRAPEGWYKGGKLVFITRKGDHDYGISMLDLGSKKLTRLVDIEGSDQHSSRLSPDGKWIAYSSNETGRQEVWVEPLPQTGKRIQLTKEGGRHPMWSPDGTKIYFDQGGRMYRLDLTATADSVQAGAPSPLPITGFQQGDLRRQFDLMPDGKAFLMLFPVQP